MAKKKSAAPAGKVYDLRADLTKEGSVLMVRPNNAYGPARAGELVRIDETELRNRATAAALYTTDEHEQIARERAELAAKVPDKSMLVRMIEEGLLRLSDVAEAAAGRMPQD